MLQFLIAVLLGLGIGAACRCFDIPLPAPPTLVGSLLVIAMTSGFLVGGYLLASGP